MTVDSKAARCKLYAVFKTLKGCNNRHVDLTPSSPSLSNQALRLFTTLLQTNKISLYLFSMKSPRHILRLVTAVFLLGIFISIHVAKALHTHSIVSTVSKLADETEKVQASSHCATCDYHFTKDSYSETATITLITPQLYSPVSLFYKSYISSSIGLHYSDRGPPALA